MPTLIRDDLSNQLIHLTRGDNADPKLNRQEAFERFYSIADEGKLIGGSGFIKGGYRCVCFTEAPISKLSYILASAVEGAFKYAPYGVMVSKQWLFQKGGRPVIYGPGTEFDELPEQFRYRHVRFYLSDKFTIDHTWEREWRIKTDELVIEPAEVALVVPDRSVERSFEEAFPDKWHYVVLSDLGVYVEPL